MRANRQSSRLPDEFASPQYLASFLASTGWELAASDSTRMVWNLPSDARHRTTLMLPLDNSFVDFDDRLSEAVSKLCDINAWDVDELVTNIVQSRSDLLLIRADQATFSDSIPLRQAESLLSGSVEMLFSAARSAISPKAHFRGKYPELAKDFMERDVRMGHTRRGSFILTIVTSLVDHPNSPEQAGNHSDSSPISSESEIPATELPAASESDVHQDRVLADVDSENSTSDLSPIHIENHIPPFQRKVMTTLASGLAATHELAQPNPRISIDDAVARGLSSNLLDSLHSMSAFEGLRALDMTFQWSTSESIPPATPSSIVLPRSSFATFKPRSETLREVPSTQVETIFGRVARVDVDDDQHQPDEGVFTIRGVTGRSNDQSARMTLTGENYSRVYRALRSRRLVAVTGQLEKIKGVWWMTGDISVENVPDK